MTTALIKQFIVTQTWCISYSIKLSQTFTTNISDDIFSMHYKIIPPHTIFYIHPEMYQAFVKCPVYQVQTFIVYISMD